MPPPTKAFDEFRQCVGSEDWGDALREFSEACRVELRALWLNVE